jgi:hypothetical protein
VSEEGIRQTLQMMGQPNARLTVVREIETLLGRQAVEDLDLEALELAVRKQVLQLAGAAVEQRLNADTSDERGSRRIREQLGNKHWRISSKTMI